MVSSLLADALTNPTAALVDLFDPAADIDEFPAKVTAYFANIFSSSDAFQEIPALDVRIPPESHKDRSLVRFRAMIQDTSASPEIYLAKRTAGCGGWGLGEDGSSARDEDRRESIDYAHLRECTVLWAVTIPGESPWSANATDESDPVTSHIYSTYKTHQSPQPHKFPVLGISHVGVQVKVYDSRPAESFRPTDLLDFVGILTSEPLHADLDLASPTPVPTLHVLFSLPVPTTIVPRVYPYTVPAPTLIKDLRDELIAWIADEGLAGDRVAAEWVLLCAIARAQSRTPQILPPSLTISRFPSPTPDSAGTHNSTPSLSHVLSHVFPIVSTLPLSLPTINTTAFAPESKNEDLHSGWLQLPKGSLCIITEGGVTEGGVVERGIINLRVLQEMMNMQTLEYIFPYSRFGFDTDVSFLTLSEGRKSAFFQTSVNVVLQPSASRADLLQSLYKPRDKIILPSPETSTMFRGLVGSAKIGNLSISEGTADYIQEDFVKERKATSSSKPGRGNDDEGFTPEDLIHHMMVARLLALSLQENEINVEIWERTKALEMHRRAAMI